MRLLKGRGAPATQSADGSHDGAPDWWQGGPQSISGEFVALAQCYGLSGETLGRLHRFLADRPDATSRLARDVRAVLDDLPSDHKARLVFDDFDHRSLTEHLTRLYTSPLDDTMVEYLELRFSERSYRVDQMGITLPYVVSVPTSVAALARESGVLEEPASGLAATAGQTGMCIAMVAMRVFVRARDRRVGNLERIAECSARLAEVGDELRHTTRSGDEGLTPSVEQARRQLAELDELTSDVVTTVDTIRLLADQTNLLALNATIEASRAGEHGRGFAVVANEVKTLASNTMDALQRIEGLTTEITGGVGDAISHMNRVNQSASEVTAAAASISSLGDDLNTLARPTDQHG